MKYIKLTQGQQAIVDDEDFDWLNQWKWYYNDGYARRNSKGGRIAMHRVINNTPKNMETDHIDRNTLNNQKNNLRSADRKLNNINRGIFKNNSSRIKGVHWKKSNNKWYAQVTINKKCIYIGLYSTLKEAEIAFTHKKDELIRKIAQ